MNKFFSKSVSIILMLALLISSVSCSSETKLGSMIETATISISYIDEDGAPQTMDVDVELYLNFAPTTIEHFKYLAKEGYYDKTVVNNVGSYMEFGEFYYEDDTAFDTLLSKYDENNDNNYYSLIDDSYIANKKLLVATSNGKDFEDTDVSRYTSDFELRGEFSKNGYAGNKLDLSNGALVLKRDILVDVDPDDGEEVNERSVYNTAKATLAFTFGANSYYDSSAEYAILGKLVNDDGNDDEDINSSLENIRLLLDYDENENGEKWYYYSNQDSKFLTANAEVGRYFKYVDGEYFALNNSNGLYDLKLEGGQDEEHEDLVKEFSDYSEYLMNLPYNTITITKVAFN